MTETQLDDLATALDDFLQPYLFCCDFTQTFEHLHTYCRGLLSDLERKSVEPIALISGTATRTLQEFLRDHRWDQDRLRQQLQRHVADTLPQWPDDGLGVIGLIDETASVKSGRHTPGVQRQWCGTLGKTENCIVSVHLGVCKGRYKTLLDAELFLPESWAADRERCRQAGIPDHLVHRPKWQIALEEVDRALANAVPLDWLTFDEEYGKVPEFVRGLDERQLRFVGEVPKSLSCLARSAAGRRPGAQVAGRTAEEVVRNSPAFTKQSWRKVKLTRQTLGVQVWEVKAAQVWQVQGADWSERTYWLIWARNVATGEEKYFLSNASEKTAVVTLVRVAFRRWHVEHGFRVSKSELGFSHYEGRHYRGLMRHQMLCLLMLTFVAEQTEQLRGEKSGGNAGAGVRGDEALERGVAGASSGDEPTAAATGADALLPATESGGAGVAATAAVARAA